MIYVELLSTGRRAVVFAAWLTVALVINMIVWVGAHAHAGPAPVSLDIVWACAGIAASIFATIVGSTLAAENDGHLPVAWTKPFSRVSQAVAKFAIDLASIAFVFAFTCGVVALFLAFTGLSAHIVIPSDTSAQFARFVVAPAAFFGLMQALTSTVSRQAGLIIGFTWVALVLNLVLSIVPLPTPFHTIAGLLDDINPLAYVAFSVDDSGTVNTYGVSAAALALALIALIGGATAIYRWQRSEA